MFRRGGGQVWELGSGCLVSGKGAGLGIRIRMFSVGEGGKSGNYKVRVV